MKEYKDNYNNLSKVPKQETISDKSYSIQSY